MVDTEGKILIGEDGMVKQAANGHGGTLHSMEKCGVIEEMKEKGIEDYLNCGGE